jgi:hypothetical protein
MATCVGCGAELSPDWKFCIHCGIATDAREISIDPVPAASAVAPVAEKKRSRVFLIAGVCAFVVAAVLLIVAISYLVGALN